MIQRPKAVLLSMVTSSIVALALSEASVVTAAPIQFRMTGTIDVVYQVGPLPPGIFQDAPFEAILSYDLATPDSQPDDPNRGYYPAIGDDVNFLRIRAGVSEIRSIEGLALWVGDDVDVMQELFESRDDTFAILDAPVTATFEISRYSLMVFRWNDPTRSVFSSDALPTFLDPTRFTRGIDPTQFTPPYIEVRTFQLDPRVHQFTIHAFVESIEVVPEPGTVGLVVIAAATVGVYFAVSRARSVVPR